MIESILPAEAAWSELFDDLPDADLLAEEEELVGSAVDTRRREFTAGRACARAALAKMGIGPVPILRGDRGAPCWPSGIVGSITHCVGYRAAAAGRNSQLATLGIDAEPDEPLAEGLLELVALPLEMAGLRELARIRPTGPCWDRLVFSAKESVYKAWFPLTGRWLDFQQATLTIDPEADAFEAQLRVPGPTIYGREVKGFSGRWLARDGLIITAVALPAPPP